MIRNNNSATVGDLVNGFAYDESAGRFACLFCGVKYEDGDIYAFGSRRVDARKAVALHVKDAHGGAFAALLSSDKRDTGLTEVQRDLLLRFYSTAADKDIAAETGLSPSTLRFQRHSFREKAKQAKVILALSKLLEARLAENTDAPPAKGTCNEDTRLDTFFSSTDPLVLKTMAVKRKNQQFILEVIARQFVKSRIYTEPEVNDILRPIYEDYVGLRRALIDAGHMTREKDGSAYRLCER